MSENNEYLPSSQAAVRGFTGFCLDEFRDDCIVGSEACLDWQRCYSTLGHLDDDRKPRMKDKREPLIDLRKAARDVWPDDREARMDIVASIMAGEGGKDQPTVTCTNCLFKIPSGTDDYFNSNHTKIICPACNEVNSVDLAPGPLKLVKMGKASNHLCVCRDPYFVGGVCVSCGFPRVERRKSHGYTIY